MLHPSKLILVEHKTNRCTKSVSTQNQKVRAEHLHAENTLKIDLSMICGDDDNRDQWQELWQRMNDETVFHSWNCMSLKPNITVNLKLAHRCFLTNGVWRRKLILASGAFIWSNPSSVSSLFHMTCLDVRDSCVLGTSSSASLQFLPQTSVMYHSWFVWRCCTV